MLKKMTVVLSDSEREALGQLASLNLRAPDDQLRWLLRQELLRRGLIESGSKDLELHELPYHVPSEVEL